MTKLMLLLVAALFACTAVASAQTPAEEAQSMLKAEDYDGAIDLLKQAVKQDETNSEYRGLLGRAYIEKLRTVPFFEKGTLAGRAQDELKKAIELDPANIKARIYLANYYLNAPPIAGGSAKKAREQAEVIAEFSPLEGKALLAGIHQREKNFDQAIVLYRECIEARPEDVQYRYQLAMLHQELMQYDEAFAALEDLLKIDAEATGAMYQVGRTAVLANSHLDRGIKCLSDYLDREVQPGYPGHDAAHWRLGMIYQHQGESARAREAFETAIGLNPDEAKYRDSLAALDQN
jgi:tetratricopeptide (TPR) repeat protein